MEIARRIGAAWTAARRPRPSVLMAQRIGRRYSPGELAMSEYLDGREVYTVRAFPVPGLVGAIFGAASEAELPSALEALLRERLCVFEWRVDADVVGPLRKYGFLHTSVDAPLQEHRTEPMWLELVGDVVTLRGGSAVGRPWPEVRGVRPVEGMRTPLAGPIEIRISDATYSNTRYPGIGVGFYI